MTNFFQTLRLRPSLYIGLLVATLLLPLLVKIAFTGSLGPSSLFYFFTLWVPSVSLMFAFLKGVRSFVVTAIMFQVTFAMIYFSLPEAAPMNFQRQWTHEGASLLIACLMVSTFLQLRIKVPYAAPKMN